MDDKQTKNTNGDNEAVTTPTEVPAVNTETKENLWEKFMRNTAVFLTSAE